MDISNISNIPNSHFFKFLTCLGLIIFSTFLLLPEYLVYKSEIKLVDIEYESNFLSDEINAFSNSPRVKLASTVNEASLNLIKQKTKDKRMEALLDYLEKYTKISTSNNNIFSSMNKQRYSLEKQHKLEKITLRKIEQIKDFQLFGSIFGGVLFILGGLGWWHHDYKSLSSHLNNINS